MFEKGDRVYDEDNPEELATVRSSDSAITILEWDTEPGFTGWKFTDELKKVEE